MENLLTVVQSSGDVGAQGYVKCIITTNYYCVSYLVLLYLS